MTPEQIKALLDVGMSGVLLAMLFVVYNDGKAERQRMLDKLDAMLSDNVRVRERLAAIEAHLGIDHPTAQPTRP